MNFSKTSKSCKKIGFRCVSDYLNKSFTRFNNGLTVHTPPKADQTSCAEQWSGAENLFTKKSFTFFI